MKTILFLCFFIFCASGFDGDEQFSQLIEDAIVTSRDNILSDLREANGPFVELYECVADNTKGPSTATFSGSTLSKIKKSQNLYIGALKSQQSVEEFQVPINHVLESFSQMLGVRINRRVIRYNDGETMINALLKGDIDLIHPGFYVNAFSAERLKKLHPLCSSVGFELAFYVKETFPGSGQPYKNVKVLIEETVKTNKKIVLFSSEIGAVLQRLYPTLKTTNIAYETSSFLDDLEYLTQSSDYTAVFRQSIIDNDDLVENGIVVLKNNFILPLMMYSRVENSYIAIPEDVTQKFYYTGNVELRRLLDGTIYDVQRGNTHFSFSESDRSVSVGDCIASQPVLPEVIKMGGTLQRIKGESKIRVGYVYTDSDLIVVSDGKTPVQGLLHDLEKKIFRKIAKYLRIDELIIDTIIFNNENDLFRALDKGEIDVTTAGMLSSGLVADGSERRWVYEYTCATSGWPVSIVTPKKKNNEETIKSVDMLKIYLQKNPKAKIVVSSSSMINVVYDVLDIMDIQFKVVRTNKEGYEAVIEEDAIAFVPGFISSIQSVYSEQLHKIVTDEYVSTTMFLRKDRKNKKPATLSVAAIILIVILSILFGALLFIVLFMLFKRTMNRWNSGPSQIIEIVSDDDKDTYRNPTLEGIAMNSIGDEDDPDYVTPSFLVT